MLRADDANRKFYSFDEENEAAGVKIMTGAAHIIGTESEQRISVPQQIVSVIIASSSWSYKTSGSGEETIAIGIAHLEPPGTPYLDMDVSEPTTLDTPEMHLARTRRILMRGTLYLPGQTTAKGKVVHPYLTPKLEDGTYDPEQIVLLNSDPPQIRTFPPVRVPLREPSTELEFFAGVPVRDSAINYVMMATYKCFIADRER